MHSFFSHHLMYPSSSCCVFCALSRPWSITVQEFKDIYYKPVSSYCVVKKTRKLGEGAYGSVYLGTISNQVCVCASGVLPIVVVYSAVVWEYAGKCL